MEFALKNKNSGGYTLLLFSITIFVSSWLLFWIQPLFTKNILPILGGSPSVWNTAMVCFQILLLTGYWYADLLTKIRFPNIQAVLHVAITAIALSWMWIASADISNLEEAHVNPISWEIYTLFVHVAVPFFLLATTSTLIQRWYASIRANEDVYWLYIVSNIGSMLGVVGFIALIEPFIGLSLQAQLFKWCFSFFALLLICCSFCYGRKQIVCNQITADTSKLSWATKLRWLLLSAVPSGLLLGTTTHITMDIAPVPLLWMLILALYLISFMVAFSKWRRISLAIFLKIQMLLCVPLLFEFFLDILASAGLSMMLWHMAAFYVTALVCHRLLYESRPSSDKLTTFYLYLSIGGAVGGMFTTFVAPLLFNSLFEYPLLFALALMLRPSSSTTTSSWHRDFGIAAIIFIGLSLLFFLARTLLNPFRNEVVGVLLVLGFFIVKYCFDQKDRPLRLGFCYMAAVFAGVVLADIRGMTAESARNFYGIVTVSKSDPNVFFMRHGTTTHGVQYVSGEKKLIPLGYYHPSGPLGDLMKLVVEKDRPVNIAVIGLGVGSISCYGRKDDKITFFEINPEVIRLAHNINYFTYLEDCDPTIDMVVGDGRINLERDQRKFDAIILDAFTSDAIPVHLLTREAFNLYAKHLNDDGVIIAHISNRYLNLGLVVRAIATAEDMSVRLFFDKNVSQEPYKKESFWTVMGKDEVISKMNLPDHWQDSDQSDPKYLWTDDYSNILLLM